MPENAGLITESAGKDLSENEKRLLEYLAQHDSINNKAARELLGLKDTAIKNLLRGMCEKKLIVTQENGRNRRYVSHH